MSHHVAIRASAGAGKTYQLTSRYVDLLARGERVDQLLASTFSRKAAGEIILRVLGRLAADPAQRALLSQVAKKLHRLRIGTLDAFFMSLVQSFGLELGFSPSWRILDEALDKALKKKAVTATLGGEGEDVAAHVVAIQKGEPRRGIVRQVESYVEKQLSTFLDAAPEAWDFAPAHPQPLRSLEDVMSSIAAIPLDKAALQKGRDGDLACMRARDYAALATKGISSKVLAGEPTYSRVEIPSALIPHYQALHAIMRFERGKILREETLAVRALLAAVAERYAEHKRTLDGYSFDDISRTLARELGGELAPDVLSDIYFRLDGRIHHLLLDEFQDTSLAQWQVLEPLASEIAAHGDGSRSFFCVGDVKQAIYGWRGGVSEIFDRVDQALPGIEQKPLDESRRSSSVIIDFVNRVFGRLDQNVALDGEEAAVRGWTFVQHRTVHTAMPGHVRLLTAPRHDAQPEEVLRHAADEVASLASRAPDASIGVLVRTNGAVRRLIWELSKRGVPASEEGGNPVTDAPAVTLVLSLLTLADHPSHTIARFHVATSPLGEAIGYRDWRASSDAWTLSGKIRRAIAEQGYGATVRHYAALLAPRCDARNARRLAQLAELAQRYDGQARADAIDLLRTSVFCDYVRETKMEEPLPAPVRVMTIHQAKGLEFDACVVCDIDEKLAPKHSTLLVDRGDPLSPPQRVFRAPSSDELPLFPELQAMAQTMAAQNVKEKLSNLYVALTRPKHALTVIIQPDVENAKRVSLRVGNVVRAAVRPEPGVPAGSCLYEAGDPEWFEKVEWKKAPPPPVTEHRPIRLRAPKRFMTRATPSRMEGGMRVDVQEHLRLERVPAMERGALLHAWLEQVAWLDDGVPDEGTLREAAARFSAHVDIDAELPAFYRLLETPGMKAALSRERFGAPLRVYREMPFAVREGHVLLTGSFDRVVVRRGADESALWIIDWKTDRVSDEAELQRRVAYYKPQLEAYRRAAVTVFRVPVSDVQCELVFLAQGGRSVIV